MMELIVRSVPCGECRKRGKKMAEIYLAGGCFWGLEEYFSRIPGVEQTTVGYANGQVETTNYQLIKKTDHAETVQVIYDPDKITLRAILLYYFRVIDPLSVNKQGNDRGRQYRTSVYYTNEADREVIAKCLRKKRSNWAAKSRLSWNPCATISWLRTTTKTTSRRILEAIAISM